MLTSQTRNTRVFCNKMLPGVGITEEKSQKKLAILKKNLFRFSRNSRLIFYQSAIASKKLNLSNREKKSFLSIVSLLCNSHHFNICKKILNSQHINIEPIYTNTLSNFIVLGKDKTKKFDKTSVV